MRHLIFVSAVFLFQLNLGSSEFKFFLNIPIGAYQMDFKSINSCDPKKNYKIQSNLIITQSSKNVTEIKGNITNKIPLDDNLTVEINVAMKDPNNGWKENLIIQKVHGACSMFKNLMGQMWIPFLNGLGFQRETCPIPVGFYSAPGLDTSIFMKADNIPKAFIHGLFKFRISFTLKKEIINCIVVVIDIKRP